MRWRRKPLPTDVATKTDIERLHADLAQCIAGIETIRAELRKAEGNVMAYRRSEEKIIVHALFLAIMGFAFALIPAAIDSVVLAVLLVAVLIMSFAEMFRFMNANERDAKRLAERGKN